MRYDSSMLSGYPIFFNSTLRPSVLYGVGKTVSIFSFFGLLLNRPKIEKLCRKYLDINQGRAIKDNKSSPVIIFYIQYVSQYVA